MYTGQVDWRPNSHSIWSVARPIRMSLVAYVKPVTNTVTRLSHSTRVRPLIFCCRRSTESPTPTRPTTNVTHPDLFSANRLTVDSSAAANPVQTDVDGLLRSNRPQAAVAHTARDTANALAPRKAPNGVIRSMYKKLKFTLAS